MSPLKLFEYMACRIPIVTTDLPVIREVIRDRDNGILCPPENLPAWKKALIQLADNPELRSRVADSAYKDFCENYTWEIRAKRILDFMEKKL
jgi:glycosyltransferase involved in cell wall biosynthesis